MFGEQSEEDEAWNASKRDFLKTVGTVGATGIIGTGVVGATVRKKRVPKYVRGDEIIQTMKVPQPWLAQDDKAEAAVEALNRTHFGKDGVLETGLVRSEQTFGGWNGFDIEVVVDETQPIPSLPDEVSGVTVRVEKQNPEERRQQACKNIDDYYNYKEGVNIFDSESGSRHAGTSGYRATKNGNEYMITAAHTFQSTCDVVEGQATYQYSSQIGNIQGGDVEADFVATDGSSLSGSIVNKVLEPDGTTRNISGSASEEEIDRRVSDYFDGYTKLGITTGKTTGGLGKKNITKSSCNDLHGEGIRGSSDGANGDSGGPYYSVENGDAFILGHHIDGQNDKGTVECGGTQTRTDKSIGMPAFWLVNNRGYTIG